MNYSKSYIKHLAIAIFALLISDAQAFSAVDYYLKLDDKGVKEGKLNDDGRCSLKNLSSGEYTLSLSKKSLREFAGTSSGVAINEEGVQLTGSSSKMAINEKGLPGKNSPKKAKGNARLMNPHLYIRVLDNGKEIAGKKVAVSDFDGDGTFDLKFSIKTVKGRETVSETLEVRVDRIEMK